MKKRITLFIGLLSIGITQAQKNESRLIIGNTTGNRALNYTLTTLTDSYSNLTGSISLNNGQVWDDPEYVVPIGFPFQVNGTTITALNFDFGLGALLYGVPINDAVEFVFAFDAEIIDRGIDDDVSLSTISYNVYGSPGNRIFKLEWKNVGGYADESRTMFINFQLWLYETTNVIEFRFGPNMISDPNIFYESNTGAWVGVLTYDEPNDVADNVHLVSGPVAQPFLITVVDDNSDSALNATPANGTIYRLAPIEVSAVWSGKMNTANIYPNPGNGVYLVELSQNQTFTIEVLDNSGRFILNKNDVSGQTSINLISAYADGIYNIRLVDETGNVSFAKLVKQ